MQLIMRGQYKWEKVGSSVSQFSGVQPHSNDIGAAGQWKSNRIGPDHHCSMWKWNQPNIDNQQDCVLFLFDWLTHELTTSGQAHTPKSTTRIPESGVLLCKGGNWC